MLPEPIKAYRNDGLPGGGGLEPYSHAGSIKRVLSLTEQQRTTQLRLEEAPDLGQRADATSGLQVPFDRRLKQLVLVEMRC